MVYSEYVQGVFRVCLEYVQSMFKSMFRVCSEYVQSMFIAISSASSVSIFGIFGITSHLLLQAVLTSSDVTDPANIATPYP